MDWGLRRIDREDVPKESVNLDFVKWARKVVLMLFVHRKNLGFRTPIGTFLWFGYTPRDVTFVPGYLFGWKLRRIMHDDVSNKFVTGKYL